MEYYPNLVFLHISDAVAFSIKQKNFKKVQIKRFLAKHFNPLTIFRSAFLDPNLLWYRIVVLLNV